MSNVDVETRGVLKKYQFGLTDLLTFAIALPVFIGIVEAIEFHSFNQAYEWFGFAWWSDVRHFLIDGIGVPRSFATGYVTFAMFNASAWVCYFPVAAFIGLLRFRWAFPVGLAFITSIFVWDLVSDYFSGLHWKINLRLVSLFGVCVTALCFAIGRRIRGGTRPIQRKTSPVAFGITSFAIVACLVVSVYGWWLIDLERKSGLEAQKLLRDSGF